MKKYYQIYVPYPQITNTLSRLLTYSGYNVGTLAVIAILQYDYC